MKMFVRIYPWLLVPVFAAFALYMLATGNALIGGIAFVATVAQLGAAIYFSNKYSGND